MKASPRVLPGTLPPYDTLSPGKSEVTKKIRIGKIDTSETPSPPSTPGWFTPPEVLTAGSALLYAGETSAREWILNRLHPRGPHCPRCRSPLTVPSVRRFWAGARVHCRCGAGFTALTGTILSGTRMTYTEVILLALMLALGVRPSSIAAYLGDHPDNIRIWRKKFDLLSTLGTK